MEIGKSRENSRIPFPLLFILLEISYPPLSKNVDVNLNLGHKSNEIFLINVKTNTMYSCGHLKNFVSPPLRRKKVTRASKILSAWHTCSAFSTFPSLFRRFLRPSLRRGGDSLPAVGAVPQRRHLHRKHPGVYVSLPVVLRRNSLQQK